MPVPIKAQPLQIANVAALYEHEKEIIARLAARKHGGNLFLIDPFRALAEAHVNLAPEVIAELRKQNPGIPSHSPAYDALASGRAEPASTVALQGLFRRAK